LTGSQWTGLTVSLVCVITLIAWAVRGSPRDEEEPIAEESIVEER
jgi:hypothetical protein